MADILIRLVGDAASLRRALRDAGGDLDETATRAERVGQRMQGVGKAMAAGLTAPLMAAAGAGIKAASDLAEAVNVTGLAFGDMSDEIISASESSAQAVGLSQRAYLEASSSLGGLLNNLGFAQEETLRWSTDLVSLGADLGSAFNEDPARAVEAIGSALRGETEPMRAFNVMLSDADVRLRAVEMGLADSTAEVDAHAKAQATLAIITEQTAAVQGDFANTVDGVANSQRVLKANVEDAAAALGESLLPIAEDVMAWLNGMVGSFADLDEGTQRTIVAFAGAVAAMGPLLIVGGSVVSNFAAMKTAAIAARGAILSVTGLSFTAVAAGAAVLVGNLLSAKAAAGELADELAAEAGTNPVDQLAAYNAELQRLMIVRGGVGDRLQDAIFHPFVTQDEIAAVEEMESRLADLRAELVDAALGGQLFADHQDALNYYLDQGWDYTSALAAAQAEMTQRTNLASTATDGWTQRLVAAHAAAQDTLTATDAFAAGIQSAGTASMGAAIALHSGTEAILAQQTAFTESVDAMGASLSAFGGPVDAFEAAITDGEVTLDDWIQQMVDTALAQDAFAENMAILASRVSGDTIAAFEEMAERNPVLAAQMAAEAVTRTDEELAELDGTVGRHTDAAIQAMADRQVRASQMARDLGAGIVSNLSGALSDGTSEISRIVDRYSALVAAGVNPVIQQLGGQPVVVVPGSFVPGSQGGFRTGDGPGFSGASITMSHMPHGDGPGFTSTADVPAVPSFSPYGPPLVDPGRLGAEEVRELTIAWLEDNLAPQLGPGIGWEAMWQALQQASGLGQIPGVDLFSAFRPGAITATGNPSYHGMGRAVDITPSMAIFDWIVKNYGAQSREVIFSPANGRQIRNGREHMYSGVTRGDHWDHIHWAMANGGIVRATPDGTHAILGEGGSDEAVVPLDRPLAVKIVGLAPELGQLVGLRGDIALPGAGRVGGGPIQGLRGDMLPPEVMTGGLVAAGEIMANIEMLRIEALPAQERLVEIRREMARLEREGRGYTDDWVDLLREGERLQSGITADIERQAEAQRRAAEAAQRQADQLAGEVDRLLDQRDQLQAQMARRAADYAAAVAAAQAKASRDIDSLLAARNDALFGAFGGIADPFTVGWGNTAGQLTDNLTNQIDLFDEWADGIAELRGRGVSEDLITQLGLDDPASLAQVRLLLRANAGELSQLDQALASRREQTADQVAEESDMLLGALGDAITDVRTTLADTLGVLEEDLSADLIDLGNQMAQIGQDTGRSYAEAIEEGLRSGIPGIIAAAQEAAAAAAAVPASGLIAVGSGMTPPPTTTGGLGFSAAYAKAIQGGVGTVKAQISGPVSIVLDDGRQLSGYIRSEAAAGQREQGRHLTSTGSRP